MRLRPTGLTRIARAARGRSGRAWMPRVGGPTAQQRDGSVLTVGQRDKSQQPSEPVAVCLPRVTHQRDALVHEQRDRRLPRLAPPTLTGSAIVRNLRCIDAKDADPLASGADEDIDGVPVADPHHLVCRCARGLGRRGGARGGFRCRAWADGRLGYRLRRRGGTCRDGRSCLGRRACRSLLGRSSIRRRRWLGAGGGRQGERRQHHRIPAWSLRYRRQDRRSRPRPRRNGPWPGSRSRPPHGGHPSPQPSWRRSARHRRCPPAPGSWLRPRR